jgi:hypothetical protein
MPKISALPSMTSPDGADEAPVVDDSAGSTKKITLTKVKEWLQSLVGWISTAMLADDSVTGDKIATYNASRQDITTNTDVNNLLIQTGWSYQAGNGTPQMTKSVTFPVAFASAPVVIVAAAGERSGSNPSAITDFNVGASGAYAHTTNITTTGFTAGLVSRDVSSNLSVTSRVGFTWIAIGPKT